MLFDAFTIFGSWPGLPNDYPVEQLISGLEQYKVDRACTLSANSIFLDAEAGNRLTWAASRQDQRLIPIGTADPRVNGVEQVEQCAQQGFKILALFPVSQGWSFANMQAKAVLRRAAAAKLVLMIEAGRDGDASVILDAVQDLPVPVILHDINLYVLNEAIAVLRARPHTYLTTRLLCGGDTVEQLAQTVGADRLIFSSRFPVSCFSSAFLTAKFAALNDEERGAVMGGNMAALLG